MRSESGIGPGDGKALSSYLCSRAKSRKHTSIRAFAELLSQDLGRGAAAGASAELGQEALLASLSHGVERLGELVNDLIDLGRGAEAQPLAIAPLDVRGTLRSAELVLRPAVMLRGQSLALELPERPLSALA